MTIKVKEAGSAKIEATTARNTVLRSSSNATLAQFTVKPADGEEGVKLDQLTIALSGTNMPANEEEVELLFDGAEEDCYFAGTGFACTNLALDLPSK
jgi:hypothetical protein